VTLKSLTIANNQAMGLGGFWGSPGGALGALGNGGGVYNDTLGTVNFEHALVGDNVVGNRGEDCYGTIYSFDYNLVENPEWCNIAGDEDHNLTGDPGLLPLGDNGGPTWTHALSETLPSQAIDSGDTTCRDALGVPLTTDQRGTGYYRPVNGSCDIGAYEVQMNYDLDLTIAGSGAGTVNMNPPDRDCTTDTCSETYTKDTVVTLTATVADGTTFAGWDGSGPCAGETTNVCVVTMDGDYAVTATFSAATGYYLLTINTTGDGEGTVSSVPLGIYCGTSGSDCSQTYPAETPVTLRAQVGPDSHFLGWSGDCSGDDITCEVTMSEARSVTASFSIGEGYEVYLPVVEQPPAE
jgi:hypothetical protein